MKRCTDILVALASLAILAVPLALIALAVWLEDRRPPFYRGPRVRWNARSAADTFRMLKFRSMLVGASKTGVSSTAAGDPRITRVGRFLRRFKLDELPQLWNVLRGEMSLVGPRPQVPVDASLYTAAEWRLFRARPGLTDLASIVFADEAEILAGSADPDLLYNQIVRPWKSRLGLLYLEQVSLALDLRILALTAVAFFSRRRALEGVVGLLEGWEADPLVIRAARREQPLAAYPPPGSEEIVTEYPLAKKAAGA